MVGKKFYDDGDDVDNNNKKFKKGVFRVLCYQPGTRDQTPSYWCERETGGEIVERDIVEFGVEHVMKLVKKYDHE